MKFVMWWTVFISFLFLFIKLEQIITLLTNILTHLQGNL